MKKSLIIGLDLSFSCTGITISYLEDNIGKKLEFHRILFDKGNTKTGKKYKPVTIKNVVDWVYRMPTNITIDDLVIDDGDKNNWEQCETTLKAMIAEKNICKPITEAIELYKPDECFFAIENYIMPAFSGQNQLKTVGGLIMLQGFIRHFLIKIKIEKNIPTKLLTPTASKLKKFFSGNGVADKFTMVKSFLTRYDGNKLLPTVTLMDTNKIDDIVDSFALMMYTYKKILGTISNP